MADETIRRLFDALDKQGQQLARLETLLEAKLEAKDKVCDMKFEQIDKLETRVSLLEKSRSLFSGGLGFAVWAISTIIMLLGVMSR